ncbi:hypothetical protein WMY93_006365 [Mugilogobius chulae]|uniref:AIG1-type G domain-containing protein n=1 Tax=Mugilogobius chulae TaxID=88201 RepID=A0AAW0PJG8_9GOBI
MDESIRKETEKAMMLLAPGPHAILLLIPVYQFTEMETLVPAELERLFGEDVLNHTIILFTCGDYLMGRTFEQYLQREPPGLSQIIGRCNGRSHVMNNRHRQDRTQVLQLLDKVDAIVQKNGIHSIKTAEERELEKRIQERQRELMESSRSKRETQTPTNTMFGTDLGTKNTTNSVMESYKSKRESQSSINTLFGTDTGTKNTSNSVMESYKSKREAQSSIDTLFGTDIGTKNTVNSVMERVSNAPDTFESKLEIKQVSNGLHSTPSHEQTEPQPLPRTPSFRLNSEGAVLSQMSETKSTTKITSTFHHRMNSFEETSPQVSPTTSPHSSVFSSSPASTSASAPAFAFTQAPARFASLSGSQCPELRLVLVGRSGAGKSTVGNCILGHEAFRSDQDSLTAVTQDCEKKRAEVCGRKVAVVDTPDWFNSERTPEEVRAQITSCVALSSPGPHAFLMCIPVDQPAKTELQSLQALGSVFGTDVCRNTQLLSSPFRIASRRVEKLKTKVLKHTFLVKDQIF